MTCKKCNLFLLLLIVGLTLLTNSCTHICKKKLKPDEQSQAILSSIKSANSGLETFKGVGSVKLLNDGETSSFRLAWAGQLPDKLRLIILVSGRKIESFAANKESFYLKSHTGAHDFIKQNSRNTSLEKLVSIPVKTNDIISLLSGKIPLTGFKYAETIKAPDNSGYILELSKPWWGVGQRIFLDIETNITGFEMVKYGSVVYSVSLSNYKDVNNFSLPHEISINSEKASCHIKISNYFTNPEVEPSMFNLQSD